MLCQGLCRSIDLGSCNRLPRRHQLKLVTLHRKEVVSHGLIRAIAPDQVVDLTRALPGTAQNARGGYTTGARLVAQEPRTCIFPAKRIQSPSCHV